MLSEFSEHILANSIITLIDSDNALVDRILLAIDKIDNKDIMGLENYLRPIRMHLQNLQRFKHYDRDLKLYHLSRQLTMKGYFLNAITLLDEAIGFYCAESFKNIDNEVKEHIDNFLHQDSKRAPLYKVSSESKAMIKLMNGANNYLAKKIKGSREREDTSHINRKILKYLKTIDKNELKAFRKFITDTDNLRNNLAHANSSEPLEQIKENMEDLLERFNMFCQSEDILGLKR